MTTLKTEITVISADGKCSSQHTAKYRELAEHNSLETLEIIIDGSRMCGGADAPSLLGKSSEFLSESRAFNLKKLEVLEDGRCLLSYVRDYPAATDTDEVGKA